MTTEPPKPPVRRTSKERTVSPRVNGKRPRLHPPAVNVDEQVRLEEAPVTNNPGAVGCAVLAKEEDHKEPEMHRVPNTATPVRTR